jgi:hypothetical protein
MDMNPYESPRANTTAAGPALTRDAKRSWQFSLAQLLAFTTLCALILGVAHYIGVWNLLVVAAMAFLSVAASVLFGLAVGFGMVSLGLGLMSIHDALERRWRNGIREDGERPTDGRTPDESG